MPIGLNRSDLNTDGVTFKDGVPVPVVLTPPPTGPTTNSNPVTWTPDPSHFGNVIEES